VPRSDLEPVSVQKADANLGHLLGFSQSQKCKSAHDTGDSEQRSVRATTGAELVLF